jgi:lipopolysaccharide biosynthesis regulator YciM
VTPLAFQELARLEEEREQTTRAENVLRAGLVRYPQSVRMRVQLAAVMDREGKMRQAREVIEDIPALQLGAAEEASRFRYNNTTADSVAASRSFFEQNAGARMRMLADALARTAAAPAATAAVPQAQAPGQPAAPPEPRR